MGTLGGKGLTNASVYANLKFSFIMGKNPHSINVIGDRTNFESTLLGVEYRTQFYFNQNLHFMW